MEVKVLGTGCPKCKKLESIVKEVAEELKLEIKIVKVTEINEIVAHGVVLTPGLVINGKVYASGIIPEREKIKEWLLKESES